MGKHVSRLIGLLILLAGILNISSALFIYNPTRLAFLETLIPQQVTNISRTFTLLIGVFLISLARALWQRKRRAWLISLILLFTSFFSHLVKGLDVEEMLFLAIPFVLLVIFKDLYTIQSERIKISTSFRATFLILFFLLIYSLFGYFLFQGQFQQKVEIGAATEDYLYRVFGLGKDTLIAKTRIASWFEDSLSIVGVSSMILSLGVIFAPLLEKEKPTKEEENLARELVFKYGQNPLSSLALMEDKHYFFAKNKRSFIAYKIGNNVSVALGDPIGERRQMDICLKEYDQEMKRRGVTTAFVGCLEIYKKMYHKYGYKFHKIGEDVVILADKYSLEGPENRIVRQAVNRMQREGIVYEWFGFDQIPWRVTKEFDALHQAWLKEKKGPALTFAVDFYPLPVFPEGKLLAVYSQGGKLIAALTFFPYKNNTGRTGELILREKSAPNGAMEASIAQAIFHFREEDVKEVNLGLTLLSNIDQKENFTIKTLDKLATVMKIFYNYEALAIFKKRFNPLWRNMYLAYKSDSDLPKVSLALLAVNIKDKNIAKLLVDKLRSSRTTTKGKEKQV